MAILLVLGVHAAGPLGLDATPLSAGWLGVDLFFVLSGYLITGILWDSRGSDHYFSAFYVRRVLRIFPLYYLVVGVAIASGGLVGRETWYAAFLANISISFTGWPPSPVWPLWSIAVEEQFYLVWPVVLAILPGRRSLIGFCLVLVCTAPVVRLWLVTHGYSTAAYMLMPARMDALAMGGLLAALSRCNGGLQRWTRSASRALVIGAGLLTGSLVIFGFGDWTQPGLQLVGYSLAVVTFGAMLVVTVAGHLRRPMSARGLLWFGRHSYAIYLFHMPLIATFQPFGIALGLTLLLAWLSGRLIEQPILRLKAHVPYAVGGDSSVRRAELHASAAMSST